MSARRAELTHAPALLPLLVNMTRNEAVGWLSPPGSPDAGKVWERFASAQLPWHRSSATAISAEPARLRALASAKQRSAKAAWEVDLLLAPEQAAAGGVLDALAAAAAGRGAHRVFLRLALDSPLLEVARTAGFMPYANEWLMLASNPIPVGRQAIDLRVSTAADLHGLFRLYNRAVPQNVRASEAVTLEEWAATLDPIGARNPAQFVAQQGGEIEAWVRTAQRGNTTTFDVLVDPGDLEKTAQAASAACALLGHSASLRTFVPGYLEAVAGELERCGFERCAEFALLARQLGRPVGELAPAPVAEEAAWIT
jgi:hypothetical protein